MSQSPQWSADYSSRPSSGSGGYPLSNIASQNDPGRGDALRHEHERGLPGWMALAILIGISGVGGLIDQLGGASIKGGFAIALVVASLIAIISVRRSSMFTIVIAPPLVYFVASAGLLYIRSGGLSNRRVLIDYASQWLVYGFPAIAGATAAVLLVAGFRITTRR